MANKLKRFHKQVFFPEWWEESLIKFRDEVFSKGPLSFSLHAVERIIVCTEKHGKVLWRLLDRHIRERPIDNNNVFEFYTTSSNVVKKICVRYFLDNFPVDIILVIASDGTVITVYVCNKGDNHSTLDKKLYESR